MDPVAEYNRDRWRRLAEANALFTRPKSNLDSDSALVYLDPDGRLPNLEGKSVLCLAGGGGQQSVAFALLGSRVTVVDLSPEQLERDRQVAFQCNLAIQTHEGDMRDLSFLPDEVFDIVWQPYSINFVPELNLVLGEVGRILKPGGIYQVMFANPFAFAITPAAWNGEGYVVSHPYIAGQKADYPDVDFIYDRSAVSESIPPPVEYRHTLSAMVEELVSNGLDIKALVETSTHEPDPEPGSWEHFKRVLPPWLTLWAVKKS